MSALSLVPASVPEAIPAGTTHAVTFYDDDAHLAGSVAAFLAEGLGTGRAGLVVATAAHREAIAEQLRQRGCDVSALQASGRLVLLDADRTLGRFMRGGLPEVGRFERAVGDMVRGLAARHGGIHAYGEMVDLLTAQGNHLGTLALEGLWDRLLEGQPARLLCGYRAGRFAGGEGDAHLAGICAAHAPAAGGDARALQRSLSGLQQQAASLRGEVASRAAAEAALIRKTAELERSNAELQRFADVAAHDLQEPLRLVTQYLDLVRLRLGPALSPDIARYMGHAAAGAERMRELIEALIAYGDVASTPPVPGPVDTAALLAEARFRLAEPLAAAGGEILGRGLPTVRGDATKLSALFLHLIENAVKFRSAEPPRIAVAAERGDGRWVFTVRDNGIGIDPSHHRAVFEVFRRLQRQEAATGTGIGLAICKRIVEQHGGRIWVESAVGAGACFRFTLPLPEATAARRRC